MKKFRDNSRDTIDEIHVEDLSLIANKSIDELLRQDHDLLVFRNNNDEAKIETSNVLDLNHLEVKTGNIMGFLGVNATELKIRSRFGTHDEDYLLHYMLQKVFSINVFNLDHSTSKENVFDFLIYMFPHYLRKAIHQGLYKEYQRRDYNDANVKGAIDVNRHIKQNIPFLGRIAYKVREHSFDNDITQLIRHTIELIKTKYHSSTILSSDLDIEQCVNQIIQHTPSYSIRDRRTIINKNRRPFSHPYFTAYKDLHKICLQILRHEGLKYGEEKDKVYGVLFDGAWLWEEYLNTFLKQCDFEHPENKSGGNPVYVFQGNKSVKRYPDFYKENIVLDAKYKKLDLKRPDRDDMHQIITYMYLLRAERGGFVIPTTLRDHDLIREKDLGILEGYGGDVKIWSFPIPHDEVSYAEFSKRMQEREKAFIEKFNKDFDTSP
ncbi:McrC family protein [Flammeovirga sp. SJP92]|uniref:McrC family protein n=1 Tax=Flammeovirga sp. SJP92 TaxID=1775430 RepID=UPI00078864ED|nr:hypothetical protein [Flammeovirga sp. SJP92]KXX69201.1 hypothetical protein AVL50_16490 [Flammeovirga sp. SJP92]